MRDKMIHEYFGVQLNLIWEVVAKHLTDLKITVEKELSILEEK
jgi:uncharacterized protein with HEPN domain